MNFKYRRQRRELARLARTAVRARPELSSEYDRVQRARQSWLQRPVVFVPLSVVALAMLAYGPRFILAGVYERIGTERYLAAISAAGTLLASACFLTIHWFVRAPAFVGYWPGLPVADSKIAWGSCGFGLAFAVVAAYPGLWAFGFLAAAEKLGPAGWCLALAMPIAHGVIAVALGTTLAVYWPSFPGKCSATALSILVGLVPIAVQAFDPLRDAVGAMLPAGWINAAFSHGYLRGDMAACWPIVPVICLLIIGGCALHRFVSTFRIRGVTIMPGAWPLAASEMWNRRTRSIDFVIFRSQYAALLDPPVAVPIA